jgi:hypothetical protein
MGNNRSTPRHARHGSPLASAGRLQWAAWAGVLAGLGVLLVPGCSDDGIGKRYAVSGMVTYQGKPLEQGTITFEPEDPKGRIATGSLSAGRYSLTTLKPDDGALPGKYRVTITSTDVEAALANDPAAKAAEDPQKRAAAAYKAAKHLIPPKYQLAETSKLTAEVQTHSNTFDFPLTD